MDLLFAVLHHNLTFMLSLGFLIGYPILYWNLFKYVLHHPSALR
jgi:hypothetical protein